MITIKDAVLAAVLNNNWHDINFELGIVMAKICEAKREEKELLAKAEAIRIELSKMGLDTPVSWERME